MHSFSLLWVDDDFDNQDTDSGWQLAQFRIQLESELAARNISVLIKTSSSGAILDDLALTQFDLVVLDIELARDSAKSASPLTGFEVIEIGLTQNITLAIYK